MALRVEGIVDGGMHAEEALGRSSRLEALHLALSSLTIVPALALDLVNEPGEPCKARCQGPRRATINGMLSPKSTRTC